MDTSARPAGFPKGQTDLGSPHKPEPRFCVGHRSMAGKLTRESLKQLASGIMQGFGP